MRGDILSTDKHRLEKEVEKKWCDVARRHRWKAYKFSSPGNSSVPDRIFCKKGYSRKMYLDFIMATQQSDVGDIAPFGFAFFIEFKRPGGKATENQLEEHKALRELGFVVWVIDWFDKEFAEWVFA